MKTLLLFTFFLSMGLCTAQVTERSVITGKVAVPVDDEPGGITVFNNTSDQGTVTRNDGRFQIPVALGDEVTFSALPFEEFTVRIDQRILDAGELNVFVSESVTELPEVTVGSPDLSGNIEVDARRIPVEEAPLPAKKASEINDYEWEFRADEKTTPENSAMASSMRINTTDFANLFRGIYSTRFANNPDAENQDFGPLEEDMRRLYDDSFFQENMDIDRKNIYEFILFAEDNGLTKEMLEEENELELIQFLVEQSKNFKQRQD